MSGLQGKCWLLHMRNWHGRCRLLHGHIQRYITSRFNILRNTIMDAVRIVTIHEPNRRLSLAIFR